MPILVSGNTAALVSAIVVGVIGAANLAYSFLNGKWDRRDRNAEAVADRATQLQLAREEREHQLHLAGTEHDRRLQVLREERLFDQRRDAYLDVLKLFADLAEWASATYPLIGRAGQDQRPPFPPVDEKIDYPLARLSLFGEPRVYEAASEFRTAFFAVAATAEEIDAYINQHAHDQATQARMRIVKERETMSQKLLALAEAMRDALAGGRPGHSEV